MSKLSNTITLLRLLQNGRKYSIKELAEKIASLLPPYMNPGVKADLVKALVTLFKDTDPSEIDVRRIEERLDSTIEDVVQNASDINYISRVYGLADQGDEADNE